MKHQSKIVFRSLLSLVVGLNLSSCQQKTNQIKIAVALPLTGDIASLGQGIRRAVKMAVDEGNKSGKLPSPVELISFDDRSDPKEAVSVANRIVSDRNVIGVVG